MAWDTEELGYSQRVRSAHVRPAKNPACSRWEVTRRLVGKERVCQDPSALTRILPGATARAPRSAAVSGPDSPLATRTISPPPAPPGQGSRSPRAGRALASVARTLEQLAGKPGPTSGFRPTRQKPAKHLPRLRGWWPLNSHAWLRAGSPGETWFTDQKTGLAPQGPTDLVEINLPNQLHPSPGRGTRHSCVLKKLHRRR